MIRFIIGFCIMLTGTYFADYFNGGELHPMVYISLGLASSFGAMIIRGASHND